jgi:cobalt-zinc-cadmium resistance protein CzcA
MIEKLISFALKQRLLSLFAVLVLTITGIFALFKLPVDSFPDVSNVQVQIVTEPESMATEEVEQQITFPIENGLNGLPNINTIRSNSSFGLSVVTAIFDDSTDVYFDRQLVQQRLTQIEEQLPSFAPKPMLGPVVSSFSNVYMYYLEGEKYNLIDLRTIQDWQIARSLRAVPGVGNVITYGGFVKQYQVLIHPFKLKGFGLSVREVAEALAANNINAGGNFIEQGGEEIIIRGLGLIKNESDIKDIVLKSVGGTPVKVGQVADVVIGPAFRRGSASMDGKGEVVTGIVMTRKGANSKAVVEAVREKIKEIQNDLPEGVRIVPYYDQTHLIEQTIDTVKEILSYSGALVIIVLFAVLLDIRSSLIVAVIIPLSLLFSFVCMHVAGLSANLMTLGAVDFGVIVDAGVVMVENVFRHLAESKPNGTKEGEVIGVIAKAAKEVGRPIVFAISIIVAVYLPLFTLEGIEGKMFIPLALTFIYALVGALLVSLTVIPVLCYLVLKNGVREKHNPVMDWIAAQYRRSLTRALDHPMKIFVAAIVALVASFCLVPFLGSEFIPSLDEGSILLRTKLSPSIAHTESMRVGGVVENMIKSFPEVTVVVTRIGRSGMGSDLDGVDNADVYVGLKPKSEWKTTHDKDNLVNQMAAKLDEIPGLVYSFSQPIADMIDDLVAGIKADLGIKIFGDDLETLERLSAQVESNVRNVRGAADMQREHLLGLPQLNIDIDRHEIARFGLNVQDIQGIIESAVAGKVVTEVYEGTKRFGLLVRFPYRYRDTIPDIESITVNAPDGAVVPLKQLAKITLSYGAVMVNREQGQRRTAVLVNVRGRDLGSFVEEAKKVVAKNVEIPKGYHIVWGGQFENQQRAMARLSIVVPIVLLLIYILLFATFGSMKNAAIIMLNVPFALIGGIIALFITHQTLSVPALIGFIALSGVAVQNGVILISYIMQLQTRRYPVDAAVMEGACVRLRPVLMTALVAVVGLVPKVVSTGVGAEIQRPLATVVLGGLVSATILTLILLPCIYKVLNKTYKERRQV